MFNGGHKAARGPQPGTDLEYQVSVDFWTAVRGGVTRLEIQRQEVCPTCKGKSTTGGSVECPECHGSGQVTQMGGRMKFNIQCPRCGGTGKIQNDCATCDGEGVVTKKEPLEFRIKPGTRDGQRIRLAGKGNAGTNGGPAGDLYLIIQAGTHPVFRRSGGRYLCNCSGYDDGGRAGREDRCAYDRYARRRRTDAVEDSAGDADGAEAAAAGEGCRERRDERACGATRLSR